MADLPGEMERLQRSFATLVVELKYGRSRERVITDLKRVSKPGRRVYSSIKDLKPVMTMVGGKVQALKGIDLVVTRSTISGNTAIGSGGGLSNRNIMTVNNSTLNGNSANAGGGIGNHADLSEAVARMALDDQGLTGSGFDLRVTCRPYPHDCHAGTSVITVLISSRVDLPMMPSVLGGDAPPRVVAVVEVRRPVEAAKEHRLADEDERERREEREPRGRRGRVARGRGRRRGRLGRRRGGGRSGVSSGPGQSPSHFIR